MAQVYFPGNRAASPMALGESGEKPLKNVQEAYIEHKDRLLTAIDTTNSVLHDLQTFNKEEWVVRYPQFKEQPQSSPDVRRKGMRRSLSFADDPTFQADVVVTPRKGLTRSLTLASIADNEEEELDVGDDGKGLLPEPEAADFHVFRLDLKLGSHGSSTSAVSLVSQLEKSSISNLLDERIRSSVNHIEKLRRRVEDTSSKVLVTGDLNAGKSTFVNSLLRREIMPVDQQPCTTAFCEVHDAAENDGKEEVHILKEGVPYSRNDATTFTRADLSDLESFVSENENVQQMLKVYLADPRSPAESLLSNGVVDISLIDAPGLNRDLIKTTALFARQEEIDVVVFVVSAEDHFTLSAKEFLWNASNEKAYLFIVVNKYEQIRDKAKCRRRVLEQIKQLSPRTFEDAEDLVHFVDSASAIQAGSPAFDNLESSLRSFVLVKRSKSKLTPAATYMTHLLSDVDLLVAANTIVAESELERAKEDLKRSKPVLEKMKSGRETLEDSLEGLEEAGASRSRMRSKEFLLGALERVGQGKPGVESPSLRMPTYPGLFGIWDYAQDVRKALLASLDLAVMMAEDETRTITSTGVTKITQLGDEHLPEGVERSRRVFMPQAMFSVRADKNARRKSQRLPGGAVVAGGMFGLGIGLASRSDMLETSFFDIFDVHHQFSMHFGDNKGDEDEESAVTAISLASVGLGALTMVGGKTLGARGLIEGIVRVTDLFGNESARKWAAPVVGAAVVGMTAYFILELPSSIPKTVGRRIRTSLTKEHETGREDDKFVEAHAVRISREARKVLRLASWDLKQRFNSAMEERGREVKDAEDMEKKAKRAVEWFGDILRRTGEVRKTAELVSSL